MNSSNSLKVTWAGFDVMLRYDCSKRSFSDRPARMSLTLRLLRMAYNSSASLRNCTAVFLLMNCWFFLS